MKDCYFYGLRMIILYVNMFTFFFLMYLINYFIYLYNFKTIYNVTSSTSDTRITPFSGSLSDPVFKTMIKIQFFNLSSHSEFSDF